MIQDLARKDREATAPLHKVDNSDDASIPKEGQSTKSEEWAGSMPDHILDHATKGPAADISAAPKHVHENSIPLPKKIEVAWANSKAFGKNEYVCI